MTDHSSQFREQSPPPARVIAGCFAMCAFSTAIVSGIFAGNPVTTVLSRALVCLLGAYVLGLLAGEMLVFVIRDHVCRYMAENPIPSSDVSLDDLIGELRVDKLPESNPNMTAKSVGS